ncbi:MAG: GAF domain-containing protein [Armatimonadota bacterium]
MQPSERHLRTPDLAIIREATEFAISTSNLSDLLRGILARVLSAIGGRRGFVALVDYDKGQLAIQCGEGPDWTPEKLKQRLEWHTGDGKGITTYVAATGKPYRTGNVSSDPYYLKYFEDVKSEIAVPILNAEGQTRGVINVDSSEPEAFDALDTSVLVSLASVAGLGISVEEHRVREQALVAIGTELSACQDISTLASKVTEVAADVLRFEDCSVFLLNEERQNLVLEASRGHLNEQTGEASYRLGEGLTGWIAEHGEPIRTATPDKDPRWLGLHREFGPEEIGSFLGVPIEGREGVIGVLRVLRQRSRYPWFKNEFTADDERVLASIAAQVGSVVHNLRLTDRVVHAERMAAWGEMSARSAHMMGNRIFAIKGDLNELKYQLSQFAPEGEEQLRELAGSINRGVFRLEEMLQEFRDFVLATQLSLEECDLNEIVKEVIDEFLPRRSPIRLELSLTTDLPKMQADKVKLKRCFAELVENAVSFQTDGGLLRVTSGTGTEREARNLCGLSGKRRYLRVEFADAGPGVPEVDKERIFTPFFTSRAKGMGLGLSIVKGIVEAHHGRICETGSPGAGARFVIFLPSV